MTRTLFGLAVSLLVSTSVFAQCVDTAWVRSYNGPGNDDDKAFAMTLDASGNVYVTGQSYQNGARDDYATIKYYANGHTAWVRRYNGPTSYYDQARAIAVDDSGCVYVTGLSWGSGTFEDYGTIKYYSNGDMAWVRRYNGEGNWADFGLAIAVDESGNAHVTGWSWGNGTSEDYVTIKYYPNGDTAWVRRYNGPGDSTDIAYAISVDGSGNVYVTGASYSVVTDLDYTTIKYDPDGSELWVQRYNGPGNYKDEAYALVVDNSGYAHVTGASSGLGSGFDYVTIKYDPDGDELWVRRYNRVDLDDRAFAIASDSSGNVYVTGTSRGNGTYYDYATLKYYSDGGEAWARSYNGTENHMDEAYDVAADDSGNVYVTGYSLGQARAATVKYDRDGNTCWAERYPAEAYAIGVDASGNVCVGAVTVYPEASWDYVTIKYSSAQVVADPGDANRDGWINAADVVYLISYLYRCGGPPCPLEAGDANCDEVVDVTDVVYLLNYLYRGGPPPCA